MTYIKVEQSHTDDERWIEAGADAFAVHVAALVWCDRQLNNGHISGAMAGRVSLAVPGDQTAAAIDQLVSLGFWEASDNGYRILRFGEHAFPAEQVKATRARWKADKDRRRQHDHGDHSLCKDPKFCPAIRDGSTVEAQVDATSGRSHLYLTQPDQTRPDRREGDGSGSGTARTGSARATPSRAAVEELARQRCPHDTPSGMVLGRSNLTCNKCALLAPPQDDVDGEWAFDGWITGIAAQGMDLDGARALYDAASDVEANTASEIADAVYLQHGYPYTADGEAVNDVALTYLRAWVLLTLADSPELRPETA